MLSRYCRYKIDVYFVRTSYIRLWIILALFLWSNIFYSSQSRYNLAILPEALMKGLCSSIDSIISWYSLILFIYFDDDVLYSCLMWMVISFLMLYTYPLICLSLLNIPQDWYYIYTINTWCRWLFAYSFPLKWLCISIFPPLKSHISSEVSWTKPCLLLTLYYLLVCSKSFKEYHIQKCIIWSILGSSFIKTSLESIE